MPQYTATEFTRSQLDGRPYRVGWHVFDTQKQAEMWAQRRLSAPMLAPHWINIRVFRSRQTLCEYSSDGNGIYKRVTGNG